MQLIPTLFMKYNIELVKPDEEWQEDCVYVYLDKIG